MSTDASIGIAGVVRAFIAVIATDVRVRAHAGTVADVGGAGLSVTGTGCACTRLVVTPRGRDAAIRGALVTVITVDTQVGTCTMSIAEITGAGIAIAGAGGRRTERLEAASA